MKKPMSTFGKFSLLQLRVVFLLFVFPSLACAGTDVVYGSGPGGYHSYTLNVDADLSRTIQLNLDYFLTKATGVDDTKEVGAGLTWYATELVSANYRYSVANDGIVEVKGHEGGLSLALDTLWRSELRTTVDLGYGVFVTSALHPQNALIANFQPKQTRNSVGFSQDIFKSLTLYGSHDKYKYDRDVVAIGIFLIKSRHVAAASRLFGFPDKTNTLGASWNMTKAIGLDVSVAKTTTMQGQEEKTSRLGVDLQISNKLYVAAAVSRVSATAIVNPNTSVVVQPTTSDIYNELSVGWGF